MNDTRLALPNGRWMSSVTPADEGALVANFNNPAVTRFMGPAPQPYTAADAQAWIGERQKWTQTQAQEVYFGIREPGGALIGTMGLVRYEGGQPREAAAVAELGYWLAQPVWGQGLASQAVGAFVTYAFDELALHRLFAKVFDLNIASWRALEKNGFKLEGVRRQHVWRAGQYFDDRLYGLLRAEWLAVRKSKDEG